MAVTGKLISKLQTLKENNSIESYCHIKNILKNQKIVIPYKEYKPYKIIRFRRHKESNSFFYHCKELSYRTDILNIDSFGRCNEPGQGFFYCNDEENENTGLAEAISIFRGNEESNIETFTIGAWDVKSPLRLAVILPSNNSHGINAEFDTIKQDFNSFRDNDDYTQLKKFVEFISEEFTLDLNKDNTNYKITCAFSNYIKEFFPKIDGILYGSVKSELQGTNIVLWPEVVDEKLEFVAARKLTLKRTNQITFHQIYSQETLNIDTKLGKINWD